MTDTYITLCRSDEQRFDNFKSIKKDMPNVVMHHALNLQHDWEEIRKLFEYFNIPVLHSMWWRYKGGKIARWATQIMTMKYIYDTVDVDRIIVIEDDVWFNENYNFFEHAWPAGSTFVKLSRWGEMYACGRDGSVDFFTTLFNKGIWTNDDEWIRQHKIPSAYINTMSKKCNKGCYRLLCKPNHGLIRKYGRIFTKQDMKEPWIYTRKDICSDINAVHKSTILTEKIFVDKNDTNFKQVINRLK